jgi:rhamnosyltransferase
MLKVAVLLATYNSGSFIEEQLTSLRQNTMPFKLHWIDDQSSDDTRRRVQELAARLGIDLVTWHQAERLGVPGAFFQLLECVEADIYLFCDHDDIWQPGKVDATVAALSGDSKQPVFCFSEPLVFPDGDLSAARRYFEVIDVPAAAAQESSRAFTLNPAVGNTVGFTRALREMYLEHREIARQYAVMHDWWLYLLARSAGRIRLLSDVPTTLYRQHQANVFGVGLGGKRRTVSLMWQRQQKWRRQVARQAAGFLKTGRRSAAAELICTLDRRQGLLRILALIRGKVLLLPWRRAGLLLLVSALSDATG